MQNAECRRCIRPEWANQVAKQRYGAIQGICADSVTPELSLSCSVLLAEQGNRVFSRVNRSAALDSEA